MRVFISYSVKIKNSVMIFSYENSKHESRFFESYFIFYENLCYEKYFEEISSYVFFYIKVSVMKCHTAIFQAYFFATWIFFAFNFVQTSSISTRSRVNSFSSVTSDTAQSAIFANYSTPQRRYYPPSDIESEFEADLPAHDANSSVTSQASPATGEAKKLHKLLDVYKTKYDQLRNAYAEVEAEKEKIRVAKIFQ